VTAGPAEVQAVDAGIISADELGRVIFASRRALELLRRHTSPEGEDVCTLLDMPGTARSLAGRTTEWQWVQSSRTGDEEREICVAATPVVRPHGAAHGFYFVLWDLTREKQREMERRRLERLAAMGTMVAGFAHEIRNPMASLRSLTEGLVEAGVNTPHVGRMLQVLDRVERLVRNSLLFGRPTPPKRAVHAPTRIVIETVAALAPRTHALGHHLRLEADELLPDVFVDEGQLVQVLVIVLNNAIDATGSPERVLLRVRGAGAAGRSTRSDPLAATHVRFEIHDDGPGILPENVSRIFDPFFTTKASGTGLGLSIAQHLVTENGGSIQLSTAPGGPTVFSILIPRATHAPPAAGPWFSADEERTKPGLRVDEGKAKREARLTE
jgi:signal transduction histidine kinase